MEPDHAHYGFRIIYTNGFEFMSYIYTSYGKVDYDTFGVRPVIHLKSNINLQYDEINSYYDII